MTRPTPRRITTGELAIARRMLADGATISEIARQLDCSSTAVRNHLVAVGDYTPRPAVPPLDGETIARIVRAGRCGASVGTIAMLAGVSTRAVRDHLAKAGVDVRERAQAAEAARAALTAELDRRLEEIASLERYIERLERRLVEQIATTSAVVTGYPGDLDKVPVKDLCRVHGVAAAVVKRLEVAIHRSGSEARATTATATAA